MSATPQFFKRIEARIALALARAEQAMASIASLQHSVDFTNLATIGPAGSIVLAAPAFIPRTGKVRITAFATPVGGTGVAGDTVTATLQRDGAQIPGSPEEFTAIIAGSLTAAVFVQWTDTVAVNTSHVWALEMHISNGSGHTIELSTAGGGFGGLGAILVQELP